MPTLGDGPVDVLAKLPLVQAIGPQHPLGSLPPRTLAAALAMGASTKPLQPSLSEHSQIIRHRLPGPYIVNQSCQPVADAPSHVEERSATLETDVLDELLVRPWVIRRIAEALSHHHSIEIQLCGLRLGLASFRGGLHFELALTP